MANGQRCHVLTAITEADPSLDPVFVNSYLQLVPTETLVHRQGEQWAALLAHHLDLGRQRPRGSDLVEVLTPTTARDGWSVGATVIDVVTGDRQFLVESVRATLERLGHRVLDVIHPILRVERGADGQLVQVWPADPSDEGTGDEGPESWMHFEISRVVDPEELQSLRQAVGDVLVDVRSSVDDWQAMSQRMRQVAGSVDDPETAALLHWLTRDEFTFLGAARYLPSPAGDDAELVEDDHARLGLAHRRPALTQVAMDTPERERWWAEHDLVVTKSSHLNLVHRAEFPDLIAVTLRDGDGHLTEEWRFVGTFATTVLNGSVGRIPVLRGLLRQVLRRAGVGLESHTGQEIEQLLNVYPREVLFHIDPVRLTDHILDLRQGVGHPQIQVFGEAEPFGRFATFLVSMPRERYTNTFRKQAVALLREAVRGDLAESLTSFTALPSAFITVTVHTPHGVPEVDETELRAQLRAIGRDWHQDLRTELRRVLDEERIDALEQRLASAFPNSYVDTVSAADAAADVVELTRLSQEPLRLTLYRPAGAEPAVRRVKLFLRERASLTALLPVFTDLGVEVMDERPYEIASFEDEGPNRVILDLGLRGEPEHWQAEGAADRFTDAVRQAWTGAIESDALQGLVLGAGLTARQVVVLRSILGYLRQLGLRYSFEHTQQVLLAHPELAADLVGLFETKFDPDAPERAQRPEQADQVVTERTEDLARRIAAVPTLDHEAVLRGCLEVIGACVRTGFYLTGPDGRPVDTFAMKLLTERLTLAPLPRPAFELWVYGPAVEGVHLRFGPTARGGLRWSDRREDFRTEVLGLVKAQQVKNAVIVPVGAKGGFFAKNAQTLTTRDAWLDEGKRAYRAFITAMLSVTDNLVDGRSVPAEHVVRHDGDDNYLVVAADKGTATFSDLANQISLDRDFWLGDAFASGGSVGFDHKAMGITARGAWESVKRHFLVLGHDCQREPFTAVGVGDMSGDVFGNGMMLSDQLHLVAAFDHRHIFIDPNPDAAASLAERRRLFDLPRSSWADYDDSLISEGGGVFARTDKTVRLSEQGRAALGIEEASLSPDALISAILRAPVDLLWNGGIGTYVRASSQTNDEVGDRSNDYVRISADQLRCRVIGEGGNLGLTQQARVEAALAGVLLNTDAIDNSAGVDTSDHEVNIKIGLDAAVRAGRLDAERRDALLAQMVDQVGLDVLRTNYEQNLLISNAGALEQQMVGPHIRLMHELEQQVGLDRELEVLPTDEELRERARTNGTGLTAPEFSVLVAWTKIALKRALVEGTQIDDRFHEQELQQYFPTSMDGFGQVISEHPLRRQIIANVLANAVINRGGVTFVFRAVEETGASVDAIIRAYAVARAIVGQEEYVAAVEALDGQVSTQVQAELFVTQRRLVDAIVRRIVLRREPVSMQDLIDRYRPVFAGAGRDLVGVLEGSGADVVIQRAEALEAAGVGRDLARWAASIPASQPLLDVVDLREQVGGPSDADQLRTRWFEVQDRLHLEVLFEQIQNLDHEDRWDAKARTASLMDAYDAVRDLVARVYREPDWFENHPEAAERVATTMQSLDQMDQVGLAPISVALREVRDLIA